MKELSIEEKAKAYDEALERAKVWKEKSGMPADKQGILDDIFPELRESEDEGVRKALLEMVHDTTGDELWVDYNVHKEDALAWLEKQVTPAKLSEEEQNRFAKVVLSSCASSFIYYLDAHKYEGKMCVSNGECEDIENAFQNAMWDRLHRYYCKYIEKQGEKDKPTYNTYSKDVQLTQEEYDKKRVSDEATIKEVEAYKKGLEDAQKIFEKQGEPNPYSGTSFEYNGHTWGMCARDNGVDILCDKHIIGHLEKQGETFTKKDVDNAYIEGMAFAKNELKKQGDSPIKWNKNTKDTKPQINHSVLMKTNHGIAEGEWQGERWHQYRWAGIVRDTDVLSWIELSDLDNQGEQKSNYTTLVETGNGGINALVTGEVSNNDYEEKPVDKDESKSHEGWSEEDEKMVDSILTPLATRYPFDIYQPMYNWLKFLKQRIGG